MLERIEKLFWTVVAVIDLAFLVALIYLGLWFIESIPNSIHMT